MQRRPSLCKADAPPLSCGPPLITFLGVCFVECNGYYFCIDSAVGSFSDLVNTSAFPFFEVGRLLLWKNSTKHWVWLLFFVSVWVFLLYDYFFFVKKKCYSVPKEHLIAALACKSLSLQFRTAQNSVIPHSTDNRAQLWLQIRLL